LTNNFDEVDTNQGGKKIGEGAFGAVFRATLDDGRDIAIKLLKGDFDKQFLNEIHIMKDFIHENLLQLIAVSTDGPSMCLVSAYMPRGSLNSFLSQHGDNFNAEQRISVAIGTARGLSHLHSFLDHPVVHRDVKSDNILLDSDLTPKLGDFGLTRIGSHGTGTSMTISKQVTQNVIGTSVYMAPEAFRGDVSAKLDVFAFGIVLLELLTGLRPYDEKREEQDLLTHVQDQIEIFDDQNFATLEDLLDKRVPDWNPQSVVKMFSLAMKSTNQRKKDRPNMVEILATLQGI
jgi:interleukin-1 receptor-associated kinase 4